MSKPKEFPKTVNEAVDEIIAILPKDALEKLASTAEEDLIKYHFGLGQLIRNDFGLWKGNKALLKDAGSDIPDSASTTIIKALWRKIKKQESIFHSVRITIPKKYREKLSKNLVITRGIDWCLFVYDKKIWKQVKNRLEEIANKTTSKDEIDFVRLFMRGATKVKIGSNNRIIIPEFLSHYAFLKKNIVFIELGKRFEIWSAERFEKYQYEYLADKGANDRRTSRNSAEHIHRKAL